ncbi:MAG: hypothetical protein WAQ28_07855 [Bacteroidia bacterium]
MPVGAITCISVKGYCDSTETDTRVANLAFNRAFSTFYCLNLLGIPPDKMAILNPPGLFRQQDQANGAEALQKAEISIYW